MIAAAGISNTWRTRDTIQQSTDDVGGILTRDFRTVLTDNRSIINGLLGFGAEFGENKIRWTNLYIHDTLKQGRLSTGSTSNIGDVDGIQPFIVQNTSWFERQLIDTQLVGEFKFGDFALDTRGSYAETQRNSPYERQFTYQYNANVGDYTNNLSGLQSATVASSELDETLWSGQANLTWNVPFDRPFALSVGYAYSDTDRTSSRYTFRYQTAGNVALNDAVAQQRPDYLLSDFNLQTYGIGLANTCVAPTCAPTYDASLRIHGAYAQVEGEITDGLRANFGIRYEDALETVLPGGGVGVSFAQTNLARSYWLPAVTVTWNFASDMQVRGHMSKTLARPQFRELAQQLYQDTDSDRSFIGNPFLKDSRLTNFEARYEYYFGRGERLTAAGFYKKIDNPIETVSYLPGRQRHRPDRLRQRAQRRPVWRGVRGAEIFPDGHGVRGRRVLGQPPLSGDRQLYLQQVEAEGRRRADRRPPVSADLQRSGRWAVQRWRPADRPVGASGEPATWVRGSGRPVATDAAVHLCQRAGHQPRTSGRNGAAAAHRRASRHPDRLRRAAGVQGAEPHRRTEVRGAQPDRHQISGISEAG
ncbi:MAG: TonB-dependent receptor [Sphingobium sp.]|nr:TonB-dependent receptor [Sphingobium sp.]